MIDFKNRQVPYLIGEIGINHNGNLEITKKLIAAAYACNWDCVKFQKRTPDICVPDKQKYVIRYTPWGAITYLEYKKKLEFEKKEYDYIDKYCKDKPIDWSASVWDLESLDFLLQYDVPFIKIPSALLTDDKLLKRVSKTGKTIILSTGMSTIEEIDKAVNIIQKGIKRADDLILMHCCSTYPTPIEEINLNIIPFLKKRFDWCRIGFSDHTYDLESSVVATALGVDVIEKHITLDHKLFGTDQSSSLEVHAMDMLRKRIKDVRIMMGDGIKKVTEGEKLIMEKLRKV